MLALPNPFRKFLHAIQQCKILTESGCHIYLSLLKKAIMKGMDLNFNSVLTVQTPKRCPAFKISEQ